MPVREIARFLPNLPRTAYEPTSPMTEDYNCVGWAIEHDIEIAKWWQPPVYNWHQWPSGFSNSFNVENFIKFFEEYEGFARCDDAGQEDGFEKIAIHRDADGDFSHVSRQRGDGVWVSKLGDLDDIEHVDPHVLEPDYGPIVQYMKRPFRGALPP